MYCTLMATLGFSFLFTYWFIHFHIIRQRCKQERQTSGWTNICWASAVKGQLEDRKKESKGKVSVLLALSDNVQVGGECAFCLRDWDKYVIDSLDRVRRKTGQSHWHHKMHPLSHLKKQCIGMSGSLPHFWMLKIYPGFSLSPYLRMLRAAWHGRRHNLQPADNGLIHPPRALWLAKVVPVLCTPQQEGPGQCLDRCRKWQMAVDSGKAPSQYREHAKPGRGQGQMDRGTDTRRWAQKVLHFVVYVCLNLICLWRIPSM